MRSPEHAYRSRRFARRFDRLRRYQRDRETLGRRIDAIHPLRGARVVELGAGTGVVTEVLCREAATVVACDRSPAMLELARRNLDGPGARVSLSLAEHPRLPLPDGCADLVVAAFSLDSLLYDSDGASWRDALARTVAEMRRLAARDGAVVIIGSPHGARGLGDELERAHGFARRLFKTTWRFPSRGEARAAVELFFSRRVWRDYRPHFPKDLVTLAGIWWR